MNMSKKNEPFIRRADFRVLFVSNTPRTDVPYFDPSVRYRCYNPAEVMTRHGILADVVALKNFSMSLIDNYDAFIFHRPSVSDTRLKSFIDYLHMKNKFIAADYDDLIFAPEYALQSSIYVNHRAGKAKTEDIFKNNYEGLCFFEYFTVSTEPLKKHIETLLPQAKVMVIPNGLSSKLLDSLEMYDSSPRKKNLSWKLISYLSGTLSHNADFAFVAPVLNRFLQNNGNFRLGIYGRLDVESGAVPVESVIRFPVREYREFFTGIGSAYLNIAPLLKDNVFNECKSALKFFESGIWGVPTIASPNPDFLRFKDAPGLLLAETEQEWTDALEKLSDAEVCCQAATGLREYCLTHCLADAPAAKLQEFLTGDHHL